MPKYVTPQEAVEIIKSGDMVGINAFLALVNPVDLIAALGKRFEQTGEPKDLSIYCATGFGSWTTNSRCELPIRAGAVKKLILSHFATMPDSSRMILDNKIEGYNLPLGVMSHMVRAAAAGQPHYITKVGCNLFVDPKIGGSKLNESSKDDWVSDIEIEGERFLCYKTPKFDVVLIKGSSADIYGNITFEKEPTTLDALAMAQAARANGGKVIVQVSKLSGEKHRPWNVIIPGALVDYICLCPEQDQVYGVDEYDPTFSGDEFVEPEKIVDWLSRRLSGDSDTARSLIARRGERELNPGQIVNVGIGIPEGVSQEAAKTGLITQLTMTVESGGVGGMPASGKAFGSTVGAHSIISTAQMFDFYDGGGLDICFIGALEIDKEGNVNGHYSPNKLAGIGGFSNITQSSKKVVFCCTFSAGGLQVKEENGRVTVVQEGKYQKFVDKVSAVSFSAANAHANGQEILYVTERCAFRLGEEGLELIEVTPGIDLKKDILDQLPFEVKVCV